MIRIDKDNYHILTDIPEYPTTPVQYIGIFTNRATQKVMDSVPQVPMVMSYVDVNLPQFHKIPVAPFTDAMRL